MRLWSLFSFSIACVKASSFTETAPLFSQSLQNSTAVHVCSVGSPRENAKDHVSTIVRQMMDRLEKELGLRFIISSDPMETHLTQDFPSYASTSSHNVLLQIKFPSSQIFIPTLSEMTCPVA